MTRFLLILLLVSGTSRLQAQKVDSIYFHLYTDSLKKGTHNYINVDGKMSDGSWQPLTAREIEFSASDYSFNGNELIVPADSQAEKVKVKAVLRSDPKIWKEVIIWIKKLPDPDLPSREELLRGGDSRRKKHR